MVAKFNIEQQVVNTATVSTAGHQVSTFNETNDGLAHGTMDKEKNIIGDVVSDNEATEEASWNFTGDIQQVLRFERDNSTPSSSTTTNDDRTPPKVREHPSELVDLVLKELKDKASIKDILTYASVSKQFHDLAIPFLWREPKLRDQAHFNQFHATLTASPSFGKHIHHLHVFGTYWTDTILSSLIPHLTHLQTLTVQASAQITHTSISLLPDHCLYLERLALDGLNMITEPTILRITQQYPNLRMFCVRGCPPLADATFTALSTHCRKIQQFMFSFAHPDGWTPAMLHAITQWDLVQLLLPDMPGRLAQQLLTMVPKTPPPGYVFPTSSQLRNLPPLDPHDISTIAARPPPPRFWPRLQRLVLMKPSTIDDRTMLMFLHCHRQLRHLCLVGGNQISDNTLEALFALVPNLTMLHLTHNEQITSWGLKSMIRRCKKLTTVVAIECERVDWADFPEVKDPDTLDDHPDTAVLHTVRLNTDDLNVVRARTTDESDLALQHERNEAMERMVHALENHLLEEQLQRALQQRRQQEEEEAVEQQEQQPMEINEEQQHRDADQQ